MKQLSRLLSFSLPTKLNQIALRPSRNITLANTAKKPTESGQCPALFYGYLSANSN